MSLTIASIRNMNIEEIARVAQDLVDTGDYGPLVKEVLSQFILLGAPDIKKELEYCQSENRKLRQRIKDIRGLTQDGIPTAQRR